MKREIKFRAWDGKNMIPVTNLILTKEKTIACGNLQDETWKQTRIIENNLMQFTGLKDKNGKEIYEGDIVHYFFMGKEWIEPILWQMINSMENSFSGFRIHGCWANCEIIGTIYENPELLKNE